MSLTHITVPIISKNTCDNLMANFIVKPLYSKIPKKSHPSNLYPKRGCHLVHLLCRHLDLQFATHHFLTVNKYIHIECDHDVHIDMEFFTPFRVNL